MRLHNSTGTRQGLFNTGFTGFSPMALLDCVKGIAQVVPVGFPSWSRKGCEAKYGVPPESWDTTKTCGMVCCCLIILKGITPFLSVSDNAKDCSTNSDLPCRDLVAKLMRLILCSKKHSKKLPPMDERPQHSALVRGRSPLPTTQQFDTNVGTQGTTTSRALCIDSSEGGLLWGAQPENRMPSYQRGPHIQCRNLWRLSLLSSSTYPGEAITYSGQCQLAQGARFERLFHRQSRPPGACFPATLFSRTQSNRTGVENHSQASYPQPLFRINRRTRSGLDLSFCKMGATK